MITAMPSQVTSQAQIVLESGASRAVANWLTWENGICQFSGAPAERSTKLGYDEGYLPADRDQAFLLPPDVREWLPAGHAVQLVIEAVARLDTAGFHARRKTGGAGAAGYDPRGRDSNGPVATGTEYRPRHERPGHH